MPRNRKYFTHNSAIFITTRTEEGLPIVPSHHLNYIIWGILAKARTKYKVKICHFIFMSNHFHLLLVVDSPQDVPRFMGYVKGEISHAINRLLGRRQKTIWQDGYDSPVLLDATKVRKYIKYLYKNPSKAKLVDSIEQYQGVSSWQMFKLNNLTKSCAKVNRNLIPKMYSPAISINEQKKIVKDLENLNLPNYNFTLEPDAWKACFEDENESITDLIKEIKEEEAQVKQERVKSIKYVIGATELRRQSMLKEYRPSKYSKRMICICSDIKLRKSFIDYFKYLSSKARDVFKKWKKYDFREKIPIGMFSPGMPVLASVLNL